MYLLKLLRHQSMSGEQLSHKLTLLLYLLFYMLYQRGADFCLPSLRIRSNAIFRRLKRFGYTTCNITVSDLIDTSSSDLFRKLCSSEHSLHHLLPPERKCSNLRNRGHPKNSRNIVLNCIKSLLLFNHCICTFDFFFTL